MPGIIGFAPGSEAKANPLETELRRPWVMSNMSNCTEHPGSELRLEAAFAMNVAQRLLEPTDFGTKPGPDD
jgi:hypothetical protein